MQTKPIATAIVDFANVIVKMTTGNVTVLARLPDLDESVMKEIAKVAKTKGVIMARSKDKKVCVGIKQCLFDAGLAIQDREGNIVVTNNGSSAWVIAI